MGIGTVTQHFTGNVRTQPTSDERHGGEIGRTRVAEKLCERIALARALPERVVSYFAP
jgi:hypothetical protein